MTKLLFTDHHNTVLRYEIKTFPIQGNALLSASEMPYKFANFVHYHS